jgi:hypothetical protein
MAVSPCGPALRAKPYEDPQLEALFPDVAEIASTIHVEPALGG